MEKIKDLKVSQKNENEVFSILIQISAILKDIFNNSLSLDSKVIVNLKNAPVTSVFSVYKNILTDAHLLAEQ